MHAGAFNYVKHVVEGLPPRKVVLEYGGRNINGSVRSLFNGAQYCSIDLSPGPGVDILADAARYRPVGPMPDTIVCCEVLEHTAAWRQIIRQAYSVLRGHGVLIVTCATEPRAVHSAVDGRQGLAFPDEYYMNIMPETLISVLNLDDFEFDLDIDSAAGDLYVTAYKGGPGGPGGLDGTNGRAA